MLITSSVVKEKYKDIANKNNKLARDVKKGNLIKIRNGLYETNPNTPGYLIANSIYGPSYISFDYALAYYGLIMEKVTTITSATFAKKKKKQYINHFGVFTYRDIPSLAYPEEVILKTENNYAYQIASAEKALCDKLYILPPIKNLSNLKNMLFSDLRIDEEELKKLQWQKIEKLSQLYHSRNVDLLAKFMKGESHE